MDNENCAICLEDYAVDDIVFDLTFCGHTFHENCLDEWFKHGNLTCPLCRQLMVFQNTCMICEQQYYSNHSISIKCSLCIEANVIDRD